jgi:hypothetical protein
LVATHYATEGATKAVENSAAAVEVVKGVFGEENIKALYSQGEGKGLTQAEMESLQA